MNLNELIEQLQEIVENDEKQGERDIMIVHQPSWPLRERVAGIYDPLNSDWEYARGNNEDCSRCDKEVDADHMAWHSLEDEGNVMHETCYQEFVEEEGPQPFYIVAGGQPYDGSPYGPRQAFEVR